MAKNATTAMRRARIQLRHAIAVASAAHAEAQWTNGYRAARLKTDAEDERLYRKEQDQWAHATSMEANVEKAITAYANAVRTYGRQTRLVRQGTWR